MLEVRHLKTVRYRECGVHMYQIARKYVDFRIARFILILYDCDFLFDSGQIWSNSNSYKFDVIWLMAY